MPQATKTVSIPLPSTPPDTEYMPLGVNLSLTIEQAKTLRTIRAGLVEAGDNISSNGGGDAIKRLLDRIAAAFNE